MNPELPSGRATISRGKPPNPNVTYYVSFPLRIVVFAKVERLDPKTLSALGTTLETAV
jgi:hypothetical protein